MCLRHTITVCLASSTRPFQTSSLTPPSSTKWARGRARERGRAKEREREKGKKRGGERGGGREREGEKGCHEAGAAVETGGGRASVDRSGSLYSSTGALRKKERERERRERREERERREIEDQENAELEVVRERYNLKASQIYWQSLPRCPHAGCILRFDVHVPSTKIIQHILDCSQDVWRRVYTNNLVRKVQARFRRHMKQKRMNAKARCFSCGEYLHPLGLADHHQLCVAIRSARYEFALPPDLVPPVCDPPKAPLSLVPGEQLAAYNDEAARLYTASLPACPHDWCKKKFTQAAELLSHLSRCRRRRRYKLGGGDSDGVGSDEESAGGFALDRGGNVPPLSDEEASDSSHAHASLRDVARSPTKKKRRSASPSKRRRRAPSGRGSGDDDGAAAAGFDSNDAPAFDSDSDYSADGAADGERTKAKRTKQRSRKKKQSKRKSSKLRSKNAGSRASSQSVTMVRKRTSSGGKNQLTLSSRLFSSTSSSSSEAAPPSSSARLQKRG